MASTSFLFGDCCCPRFRLSLLVVAAEPSPVPDPPTALRLLAEIESIEGVRSAARIETSSISRARYVRYARRSAFSPSKSTPSPIIGLP